MKATEIIIIVVLVIGGFISLFLPNTSSIDHVIGAKEMLDEVNKESRYISTDEIAQAIIENDPSFMIIDIRSKAEYKKYTIEGAINIPFEEILDDKNLLYFDQDVYKTVLFSNGSSLADQAWVRLRSYDFKGNKVMKGGVNEWYRTIINPQKPKPTESAEMQDRYLFRKGASLYFIGA